MTKEELDKKIWDEAAKVAKEHKCLDAVYVLGSLSPSRREADIRRAVYLARKRMIVGTHSIPHEDEAMRGWVDTKPHYDTVEEIVSQMLKEEPL